MAAHLTAKQWSLVWIRLLFSTNACGKLYCTVHQSLGGLPPGMAQYSLRDSRDTQNTVQKTKFRKSYATCPKQGLLTLIRAAGGVYDFQNFEEVYLCNGLSSELQNLCISWKTSLEYILLSTYEWKTAFSAIYKPKCAQNRPFLPFLHISGSLEGLFDFYDPLHHHPWTRRSPRQ